MSLSTIGIYGPTVSPFVVKVLTAADYLHLDYAHHGNLSVREVYKISPVTGHIPVAHFDGDPVFDSTLILRRFEDLSPSLKLSSQDPTIAAQQRMLEDWSDESLYWQMMGLSKMRTARSSKTPNSHHGLLDPLWVCCFGILSAAALAPRDSEDFPMKSC